MNINRVVNIESWKAQKKEMQEEHSVANYFKALQFSELMVESNDLISKIKKSPLDPELISQAKLILREFKSRLKEHSPEMYISLEEEFNSFE